MRIKIFSKRLEKGKYQNLREALRRARKATSLERYLSTAIWVSTVVGLLSAAGGYVALRYVVGLSILFAVPSTLALMAVLGYTCYRIFLFYPSLVVSSRRTQIDAMLPHAAAFMFALSKGGLGTIEISRLLSKRASTVK
jgi:pilus assembly protein TadC